MKPSFKQFNSYVSLPEEDRTDEKFDQIFNTVDEGVISDLALGAGKAIGGAVKAAAGAVGIKSPEQVQKEKLTAYAAKRNATKATLDKKAIKLSTDQKAKLAGGISAQAKAQQSARAQDTRSAAGGRNAERDFVNQFESFSPNESFDVQEILEKLVDGDLDLYSVMNHPTGSAQRKAVPALKSLYDDVATNNNLNADDDFEKIEEEMINDIENYLKTKREVSEDISK